MTSLRTYLAWFAMACAGMMLVQGAVVWAVDPVGYLRGTSRVAEHIYDQRTRHIGLIRGTSFHTVVVGTSMSELVSSRMLDSEHPEMVLNLAMSGSGISEQAAVLEAALREARSRQEPIRRVVWELYPRAYTWINPTRPFDPSLYQPRSILHDLRYAFSFKAANLMIKRAGRPPGPSVDVDLMNKWEAHHQFGPQAVASALCKLSGKLSNTETDGSREAALIETFIVPLVKGHPETEFAFNFPPVSAIFYWANTDASLGGYLALRRIPVDILGDFANVRFYDASADVGFISSLGNYKDLTHHRAEGNARVMARILAGDSDASDAIRVNTQTIKSLVKQVAPIARQLIVDECPDKLNRFTDR